MRAVPCLAFAKKKIVCDRYCLVGIAALGTGVLYWAVWRIVLPKVFGFEYAPRKTTLKDGTVITLVCPNNRLNVFCGFLISFSFFLLTRVMNVMRMIVLSAKGCEKGKGVIVTLCESILFRTRCCGWMCVGVLSFFSSFFVFFKFEKSGLVGAGCGGLEGWVHVLTR